MNTDAHVNAFVILFSLCEKMAKSELKTWKRNYLFCEESNQLGDPSVLHVPFFKMN